MAIASQAMISANTCTFSTSPRVFNKFQTLNRRNFKLFTVRASSTNDDNCNDEECAPDKEVGTVSMEWLAGEKTRVAGTFPPRTRGWTGYVEKDTAGQNNIYSVEPAVYISESAVSSGTAGSSSDGAENTAGVAAFLALIAVAAASSILIQVGKSPVNVQTSELYSGPSLSYYINKFKPPEIVEAAVPIATESAPSVEVEVPSENSAPEAPQVEVQSQIEAESSSTSSENTVS
ncbi:protein MAINTENANCE OF PSII UNDER HIGH LIGHT 1 [Euphorbia lathyris]|uniref:protein MAINTENANCE OF PSII UNDER HIGH LIGHT 1 n=1 Tax=Euphorbia lathyris TaxID=212925 RepID=UPI0033138947